MSFFLLVYAVVQGITECFPVGSSAHLRFLENYVGQSAPETMATAVHAGSALAFAFWFRTELWAAAKAFFTWDRRAPAFNSAFYLICTTVPVVVAGAFVYKIPCIREDRWIGLGSLVGGIVLWAADRWSPNQRVSLTSRAAWALGFAQCFSLICGTSRLGVCWTAGRLLGFSRVDALKQAFWMGIPVMGAACVYQSFCRPLAPELWIWAFVSGVVTVLVSGSAFLFCLRHFQLLTLYRVVLGLFLIGQSIL